MGAGQVAHCLAKDRHDGWWGWCLFRAVGFIGATKPGVGSGGMSSNARSMLGSTSPHTLKQYYHKTCRTVWFQWAADRSPPWVALHSSSTFTLPKKCQKQHWCNATRTARMTRLHLVGHPRHPHAQPTHAHTSVTGIYFFRPMHRPRFQVVEAANTRGGRPLQHSR